jgi:hypothetical protein
MTFPGHQFEVLVSLHQEGLQRRSAVKQAAAGEKMLVEEAAVRRLNASQLARIEDIEGRWIGRHKRTLTQGKGGVPQGFAR